MCLLHQHLVSNKDGNRLLNIVFKRLCIRQIMQLSQIVINDKNEITVLGNTLYLHFIRSPVRV